MCLVDTDVNGLYGEIVRLLLLMIFQLQEEEEEELEEVEEDLGKVKGQLS